MGNDRSEGKLSIDEAKDTTTAANDKQAGKYRLYPLRLSA